MIQAFIELFEVNKVDAREGQQEYDLFSMFKSPGEGARLAAGEKSNPLTVAPPADGMRTATDSETCR